MQNLARAAIVLFVLAVPILAQSVTPDQQMARLVASGAYADAVELGRSLTTGGNASVSVWFHYATALYAQGAFEEAAEAFRHVGRDGRPSPRAWYQIGRSYARMGEQGQAVQALRSAIDAGFRDIELFESDADIASVREYADFTSLRQMLMERVKPCEVFPEHRQLDFWVGDWEQRNKAGVVVGTTTITPSKLRCALIEETSNPPLYIANVLHTFDRDQKKWVQFYADSTAKILRFDGEWRDGKFHYRALSSADGKTLTLHNVLEPLTPDQIRWLYEESEDGGKTWITKFDGFYVRAKKS